MEHANKSRFFSDFYDSVNQRGLPKVQTEFPEISKLYIARLRFDALLSKTIILTDAQLLDGAFILTSNPLELRNRITRIDGEQMPIEVRSRENNLSDALLAFVKDPKREKLKGFTFSSIQDEEKRKSLKERLESSNINEVNGWEDILKIMRSVGVANENIDTIEQGWVRWLSAQEDGIVVVKKWDGQFDLDSSLESLPALITPEGKHTANLVYEKRYDRNSVDIQLYKQRIEFESKHNDKVLEDILHIKSWLYSAYNHALSHQHRCDSFESVFGMSSASPLPATHDRLDLPEFFWEKLAIMPDGDFKNLFFDNSSLFNEWWAKRNPEKLKKAMEPFIEKIIKTKKKLDVSPLAKILYRVESSLAVSLFGRIFLGFPGLVGGAIFGGALSPILERLTIYLHYRPVREISQRIMKIAMERQDNAKPDNNN